MTSLKTSFFLLSKIILFQNLLHTFLQNRKLQHLIAGISGVRREAPMRASSLRNSKMFISATIFQKSSPRPLRKLWNVIVGCHDCNCSMHLPQFSAVDAKKVNTAYSHTVLSSTELIVYRPPKTNVSRAPSGNFCVHTCLEYI